MIGDTKNIRFGDGTREFFIEKNKPYDWELSCDSPLKLFDDTEDWIHKSIDKMLSAKEFLQGFLEQAGANSRESDKKNGV